MAKDLSKQQYSATSTFIALMPTLEALRDAPISEADKLETAKNSIIQELCKVRSDCEERKGGVSQEYIIRVRMTLARHQNLDQVIAYIQNAINKGKHYTKGK